MPDRETTARRPCPIDRRAALRQHVGDRRERILLRRPHREILNMLAQVAGPARSRRAPPRSRSRARTSDVPEIARTPRRAHGARGQRAQAGDRVRITAQLIDARDGFHLWSQTYDRKLDDMFAIQDEIANGGRRRAHALAARRAGAPRRARHDRHARQRGVRRVPARLEQRNLISSRHCRKRSATSGRRSPATRFQRSPRGARPART